MTSPTETTTDTFVDAFGRCYIAGQEVPQEAYERHMRVWFDVADIIARLWRFAALPADAGRAEGDLRCTPSGALIFDPPLTEQQAHLLNLACHSAPPEEEAPCP